MDCHVHSLMRSELRAELCGDVFVAAGAAELRTC
jgi:hypothetical protein